MRNILFLAFLMSLISCSSTTNESARRSIAKEGEASIYRGALTASSNATTDYMKTTGLSGKIFGHFSQAHYNILIQQYQEAFVRKLELKGYDLSKVVMMPVSVREFDVREVDSRQVRSEGMFGGIKEHTYKKFRADYTLDFHFLYLGDNPPENLEKVDSRAVKIFVKRNGYQVVAEVDGNFDNIKNLTAINKEEAGEKVGELKTADLNLTERQKLDIRDKVAQSLNESSQKIEDVKLSLHIEIPTEGGSSIQVLADSTDRIDSKFLNTVYLKGPISRFRGSCSDLLMKIMGK